ncbi:MAG TPA: HEAT repeat domain-containing protein [Vicinamibacterales bacterium]|nr:HEAT repeat domain-containing protein [Vicinamibacterales bacterium]
MAFRFAQIALAAGVLLASTVSQPTIAGQSSRQPMTAADVDAITTLLTLEDTRQFDETVLTQLTKSPHREVRRRAIVAVARIVNPAGSAILLPLRGDADPDIVATVAFAYGQLKDAAAVPWLATVLKAPATSVPVAREAARALGKIRSADARTALAEYLLAAPATAPAALVGEALLSIGRFTTREDIGPIVRWTTHADAAIRWRAAWALFRPRDPAAVPYLMKMTDDASAEVRFWAMRGMAPSLVAEAGPGAGLDVAKTSARLREAINDRDRQVRTEALRALAQYDDDASVQAVLMAIDSPDSWMSISAVESLGRLKGREDLVVPRLVAASRADRPLALRIAALAPLAALAPEPAATAAAALAASTSAVARTTAIQVLQKLGAPGRDNLEALSADPALRDLISRPPAASRPAPIKRTAAEYRAIVERWIVRDYNGAARPRSVLGTAKGEIELELYPDDAPLGVEYLMSAIASGAVVGTEFGRVVPNFVAQQRPIRDAAVLRDEVSRRGLTRGNLSWASAGLDTGRPGYTLAVTPQPHNEGDFTALGGVVRGQDVVDRLELGDAVIAARVVR